MEMEKGKRKNSKFGHVLFSSVELQKWKVHFYIHMGTAPKVGRHFLNLHRIVEVKKVFLGDASLGYKFL